MVVSWVWIHYSSDLSKSKLQDIQEHNCYSSTKLLLWVIYYLAMSWKQHYSWFTVLLMLDCCAVDRIQGETKLSGAPDFYFVPTEFKRHRVWICFANSTCIQSVIKTARAQSSTAKCLQKYSRPWYKVILKIVQSSWTLKWHDSFTYIKFSNIKCH
jgi:hypothetical protein